MVSPLLFYKSNQYGRRKQLGHSIFEFSFFIFGPLAIRFSPYVHVIRPATGAGKRVVLHPADVRLSSEYTTSDSKFRHSSLLQIPGNPV